MPIATVLLFLAFGALIAAPVDAAAGADEQQASPQHQGSAAAVFPRPDPNLKHRHRKSAKPNAGGGGVEGTPGTTGGGASEGGGTTEPPDETPPSSPTGIAVSAITETTATVVWNRSTDNVGVAGYFVFVDSIKQGAVVEPTFVISLLCGVTSTIVVRAVDDTGNFADSAPSSVSAAPCTDVDAPGAPTDLRADSITGSSARLSWQPPADDDGISAYIIRTSGHEFARTAATSIVVGLICSTVQSFTVSATDSSNNESPQSPVFAITAAPCPDVTPPTPPGNFTATAVTATSAILTWAASTDGTAVDHYTVFRAGVPLGTTSSTSFEVVLTCGTVATFTVAAYDPAGNAATAPPLNVTAGSCPQPGEPQPLGVAGIWDLKLADEFDGSSLNTGVWDTLRGQPDGHYGDPFNSEIEGAYFKTANVTVANGSLALTLKQEATNGYPYSSGMVQSGNFYSYRYGYVESRIRVPRCDGCWPAFWTLDAPVDGHWPPEVDIFEFFNSQNESRPQFNYHWNAGGYMQSGPTPYGNSAINYTDSWHTYGLLWTASRLQVFIDGAAGPSYANASTITQVANYIILNLSTYRSSSPATGKQMLIDYVRVWQ